MLQRIDIKLEDYWFGYNEYYVFYDDEHMTQKQAEKALEFIDWGGWEPELTPYCLIVPAVKKPILSCIKEYFTDMGYDMGKDIARQEYYNDSDD